MIMDNFILIKKMSGGFLTAILATLLVAGCSKTELSRYADNEPKLDLFEYFQGNTTGWGLVHDRSGNLIRMFVVKIDGTVSDNTLTLDEQFDWSDGEQSSRTWVITKGSGATFSGTADDVVDSAAGELAGNVLNWQYSLLIDYNGSTWKVRLDDWMYLHKDGVLINRTSMSKFGLHLGEITIMFLQQPGGVQP